MSIWSDIHRRSNGLAIRKEDDIQQEPPIIDLDFSSLYPRTIIFDHPESLSDGSGQNHTQADFDELLKKYLKELRDERLGRHTQEE